MTDGATIVVFILFILFILSNTMLSELSGPERELM
jgi:hypothetical protein